jgi:DNA helicase-2/ATP-dependent DNA helicase PcrA
MANADYGKDEWGAHHLLKEVVTHVQRELAEWKRTRQEMELHDLIRQLKPLIKKTSATVQITYLMVDEFQDTDEVQIQFFIWLLQWTGARIFAVGDVKQSIYRFRGAEYTAFTQLGEQLEQLGEAYVAIPLIKNYRSAPQLLQQMDGLFHQWAQRVDRFPYGDDDRLIPVLEEEKDREVGLFFPRLCVKVPCRKSCIFQIMRRTIGLSSARSSKSWGGTFEHGCPYSPV